MADRPGALKRAVALAAWAVAGCWAPAGCGSSEPQVVLYVSADDHVARPVVRAFEEQTGIRVRMVGDTEEKKTTGLAGRIMAERDNPQADVFWSSEIFNTLRLAGEGVFEPHISPEAARLPRAFRDPQGRWYGFAPRARVIVYAPDRVAPQEVPQRWMDLTQPRFKGRIVIADPRFGTTGGHLAAMKAYWSALAGERYYEAFLMGLADNQVRMLPGGNAGVVSAVAEGVADLGFTDTDDVQAAKSRGLAVEMVYARHGLEGLEGGGTLLIPNTVARVRGGPHPAEAARLVDFLLSEQVELMLAGQNQQDAVPDPLAVDYVLAARLMPGAIEEALRYLAK